MGETNFRTQEIPRTGSKAEDGEKRKEKKKRANDGNNNGSAVSAKSWHVSFGLRRPQKGSLVRFLVECV